MKLANKSKKRTYIINEITESLTSIESFGKINYKRNDESFIKSHQHPFLLSTLADIFKERGYDKKKACKKAGESVVWESDNHQTLSNVKLFSVNHRPDFLINIDGMKIAVEIKKVDKGCSIREGIGQSIVYSRRYDFTILVLIDCTKNKKIAKSLKNDDEMSIVEDLWGHFNVKFVIV